MTKNRCAVPLVAGKTPYRIGVDFIDPGTSATIEVKYERMPYTAASQQGNGEESPRLYFAPMKDSLDNISVGSMVSG
jgi:hypothetical protein